MHPRIRRQRLGLALLASGYALSAQAQAPCPAVTNMVITSTLTTATVTATPTPNTPNYIIICTLVPVGVTFNSVLVSTPQYTFTGMSPGTQYAICINTLCTGGSVQGSTCAGVRTALAAVAPALAAQISLHPNPAHGSATLTLPAGLRGKGGEWALVNCLGQTVRHQLLAAAPESVLDLNDLAPGVYAARLRAGGEMVIKRLVVQ